jgi:hypothetical protein
VKVFALFVLVLSAGLVPTHADTAQTQTWQVTGECEDASTYYVCETPSIPSAVVTTELEPGTFFDGTAQETFTGMAPVVMNMVGSFDGLPISFTPPPDPTAPGVGWMDAYPEGLCFGAGNAGYCVNMIFDDAFMAGPFAHQYEIMGWNAVEIPNPVPEPATILLLSVPLMLGLMRWAQMSLRRLSGASKCFVGREKESIRRPSCFL